MRLIDADKAISTIEKISWYSLNKNEKLVGGSSGAEVAFIHYLDAKKAINEQQTVDAIPIIHGHWLPSKKEISIGIINARQCSVCKKILVGKVENGSNYCENCGAKMDEVISENETSEDDK